MKLWKHSLVARLVGAFLMVALTAVGLMGRISYTSARKTIEEGVIQRLTLSANQKEAEINRWIGSSLNDLTFFSQIPEVVSFSEILLTEDPTSPNFIDAYQALTGDLKLLQETKPDFQEIFLMTDVGGMVVISNIHEYEANYRVNDSYFINGRLGETIQNLYPNPQNGKPTLTISLPAFNTSGTQRLGVWAAHLDLGHMDQIVLEITGLGASSETYLVDKYNEFVTAERFGRLDFPRGVHTTGIDQAVQGKNIQGLFTNYRGTPVIGVYHWMNEREMILVAEISQEEAFAPARAFRTSILISGLILVGLLGIIIFLLAKQVARPILAITQTAVRVAMGDLEQNVPVMTQDEIGTLAQTFNHMTFRLRKTLLGLEANIAELEKAQQALGESEERFRRMAENAPDVLYRCRIKPQFRYEYISPAAFRLSGYSTEELFSNKKLIFRLVDPEDHHYLRSMFSGSVRSNQPVILRVTSRQGKKMWFEMRSVLLPSDDPQDLVIEGIGRDITEQKMAEEEIRRFNDQLERRVQQRTAQLEAMNQELEAFAYSVSHDLRAPLRSIDGYSRALKEEHGADLDEQANFLLTRILKSSQRMGELIDDLLRLSRLSRTEIHRGPVDLSALAQSIAQELQREEPERQVDFVIESGLMIEADLSLVRIAMDNLLENAWKFSSKKPHACITFGKTVKNEHSVFFIRDDGAGFDMEFSDRLFTPFQRLHPEGEFKGTGIGLATVRRIITRHHGLIWIESAPDRGTTVYFSFE